MKLWIRSQDKEDLLVVYNLGLAYKGKYGFMDKIGDIDDYCICEFINDYHVKLGTYKSKERALEVLDEIQDLIKLKQSWQLNENSFKVCIQKGGYDEEQVMKIMNKMYVYEMPKE